MPIELKLILFATAVFVIGEVVARPIFARIRRAYGPQLARPPGDGRVAHRKGLLERLVLYIGLLLGYAVILAAFGAFKLGTRLQKDSGDEITNDYFLIGNLTSLLIVLADIIVLRLILGQRPF
ncbi:hypothetical protein [Actomonas aquatica]|uniref:Uncharacterized protein n=1 Tax=Actomonas aquatica TaxID=2866162 RepID=A0ABZ1CCZ4_9BACT|nr:hypothetical protein [Opitutus sp. WL0086]WRQ89530.1 hypothetical protein K1X11_008925 [Opitutus sp. WL0086]